LGFPEAVGIPLSTPVLAFKLRPPGRDDPNATDHVRAPTPPDAENATEYGAPTAPVGSGEFVVMVNASLIGKENGFVTGAEAASFTCIVKLGLPAVVGVPLNTPVLGFRPSPDGRDPAATDHV